MHFSLSSDTVALHARVLGTGFPIVVLHGVFGSGDNWGTFGKELAQHYQVHLLDLRNHGRSPHADAFDYAHMAADVVAYLDAQKIATCFLIGHSMGGKTAMWVAALAPGMIKKAMIVDIAPRGYPAHHSLYIAGMRAVHPATLSNRAEAETRMAAHVADAGIRSFLLKNLGRSANGGFEWKHNLDVIVRDIDYVGRSLPQEAQIAQPILFVSGGLSDYILPSDDKEILTRFPLGKVETIAGAGHWVQVDKPNELLQLALAFFGDAN